MRITKPQRRTMVRLIPAVFLAALFIVFVAVLVRHHFAVLEPQGTIARQQRNLLAFAAVLSLVVILPVFGLTFHIVRTYRVRPDGSQRAKASAYAPAMDGDRRLETLWWAIPSAIILILSVTAWRTSHSLDPYRPLSNLRPPLTVQVVALQWKWLFIYPEQGIAAVNHFVVPAGTPINFQITSDAPMNSFWIPQLGGQVYAMGGMTSELHLQADQPGSYRGVSANLSGAGFADMNFMVDAVDSATFRSWVSAERRNGNALDEASYHRLRQPGTVKAEQAYGAVDDGLFATIIHASMDDGSAVPAGPPAGGQPPAATPIDQMNMMEGMQHAH